MMKIPGVFVRSFLIGVLEAEGGYLELFQFHCPNTQALTDQLRCGTYLERCKKAL